MIFLYCSFHPLVLPLGLGVEEQRPKRGGAGGGGVGGKGGGGGRGET
jgi:hypothetical protein